jgi:hypothetical protein
MMHSTVHMCFVQGQTQIWHVWRAPPNGETPLVPSPDYGYRRSPPTAKLTGRSAVCCLLYAQMHTESNPTVEERQRGVVPHSTICCKGNDRTGQV